MVMVTIYLLDDIFTYVVIQPSLLILPVIISSISNRSVQKSYFIEQCSFKMQTKPLGKNSSATQGADPFTH